MKKSLLALAVLGAFAGAASAQTSVTVYGVVDLGLAHDNNGAAAGSITRLDSGIQSGSRLGFKGTEDLGGGLSANFVLETGLTADTGGFDQGNLAFGRQTWVGLAGAFGAAKLGRQKTVTFETLDSLDPFRVGLAGDATRLFNANGKRVNNAVTYVTPTLSGFSGQVTWGLGEVAGNTSGSRHLGASGSYVAGPLLVAFAYVKQNDVSGDDSSKTALLGGTYDFNVVKAHLAYATNKGIGTLDTRDVLVGVTVPFGASAVLVDYIRKTDKFADKSNANQFALGYTYALSKRTNLYTSFSRTANDSAVKYNAAVNGATDKLLNAGIRHFF